MLFWTLESGNGRLLDISSVLFSQLESMRSLVSSRVDLTRHRGFSWSSVGISYQAFSAAWPFLDLSNSTYDPAFSDLAPNLRAVLEVLTIFYAACVFCLSHIFILLPFLSCCVWRLSPQWCSLTHTSDNAPSWMSHFLEANHSAARLFRGAEACLGSLGSSTTAHWWCLPWHGDRRAAQWHLRQLFAKLET